jgi:hypothetical protein
MMYLFIMRSKMYISEQEKERILNLHKKQIIVEQNTYKPIMEKRLKGLIIEQQNQEIETLIDNMSDNDPPEEWQKIVNKIEGTGQDIKTFISNIKNKEINKKFVKFIKNNINKIKINNAKNSVISFFKNILNKQTQTTDSIQTTEPVSSQPQKTDEESDTQKEYQEKEKFLLDSGYTDQEIKDFGGVYRLYPYVHTEPITDLENLTVENLPKNIEEYVKFIQTYGFSVINLDDPKTVENYFGDLSRFDYQTDKKGLEKLIANKLGWGTYNLETVYGNNKTKVITWYEPTNRIVRIVQAEFTNNRTDQKTDFTVDYIFSNPIIDRTSKKLSSVNVLAYKKYILDPKMIQWEDYEDNESVEKYFDKLKSWWVDKNGNPMFENRNGQIVRKSTNQVMDLKKLEVMREPITNDFKELEDTLKKYFKDQELQTQLQKLETLKNEAKNLKIYA